MKGRLKGWRRIAAHLDVSERTAKRWASESPPLPVERTHTGRVEADPASIDAWDRSRRRSVAAA